LCCASYYLTCIIGTSVVIITLNGNTRANTSCGVASLRAARSVEARLVSKLTFGCTTYIGTTIIGTGITIITQYRMSNTLSIGFITSLRVAHIGVVAHYRFVFTSGLSISSSVAFISCARIIIITIYGGYLTDIIYTLFRETSVCPCAWII